MFLNFNQNIDIFARQNEMQTDPSKCNSNFSIDQTEFLSCPLSRFDPFLTDLLALLGVLGRKKLQIFSFFLCNKLLSFIAMATLPLIFLITRLVFSFSVCI